MSMRRIESLEEIKEISLGILSAVDEFCVQNGIMYSLACGTLIGAIRHKGFIPWDDDVDIYMLRKDYDLFIEKFPPLYRGHYSTLSIECSQEWNRPYAKIFDARTILVEKIKYNVKGMGVNIDLFPIDNAPDDESLWVSYEKKRKILRNIYTMKVMRWNKDRSSIKNMFVVLCSLFLFPVSSRRIAKIIDNYSKRFNNTATRYYAENCFGMPNARFPQDDFDKTIEVCFENYFFQVMVGYDDYLRRFYGDYMKLPPKEKQVMHHAFEAYWR